MSITDPYVRRAFTAYFRTNGPMADQPANDSDIVRLDDQHYVVLRNVNGILSVYRIQPNGSLRGLKEWPEELEEW